MPFVIQNAALINYRELELEITLSWNPNAK